MRCRVVSCGFLLILFWLVPAAYVLGDTRDDLGYNVLKAELVAAVPTGAGLAVAHIEASDGNGEYAATQVQPTIGPFTDKTFTFVTATGSPTISLSLHGQSVGSNFYGSTTSIAPGVTNITAYSLEAWREKILHANT